MKTWLREHLGIGVHDAQVRKTIDAAAAKAEARVLVSEIRGNLDRLEELVKSLPDPTV